jgi:hypothetical protein
MERRLFPSDLFLFLERRKGYPTDSPEHEHYSGQAICALPTVIVPYPAECE